MVFLNTGCVKAREGIEVDLGVSLNPKRTKKIKILYQKKKAPLTE